MPSRNATIGPAASATCANSERDIPVTTEHASGYPKLHAARAASRPGSAIGHIGHILTQSATRSSISCRAGPKSGGQLSSAPRATVAVEVRGLQGCEGGASPSVGWPCMAAQLWRLWDSEVEPCRCKLRRRQLLHRPLAQQCGEGALVVPRCANAVRQEGARVGGVFAGRDGEMAAMAPMASSPDEQAVLREMTEEEAELFASWRPR